MSIGFGGFFHGFLHGAGFELVRRIVVPAVLVATPLVLWWWLGPEKPTCDAVRTQAGRFAVAQVVNRIHDVRGEARRAAVLHFANDPTDFITKTLRERLMDGGTLDLDGTPTREKIRALLNLRNDGIYDVDEAVKHGKRRKLDAVIVGTIDQFETVKGKAVLTGNVKFVRVASGEVVDIPLTDQAILKPDGTTTSVPVSDTWPLWLRLLFILAVVIAVPILLFPILKGIMRRNSNLATAGVLVLLVVIDGVVIGVMLGTSGALSDVAVFLIALAASFGYDLFMLSYAQLCRPALPSAV